jgi:hypothetical protein
VIGKRRKGIDPVVARAEGEAAHPTPDEMFTSDYAAMRAAQPGYLIVPGLDDEQRKDLQAALDDRMDDAPRVALEDEEIPLGDAHVTQGADGGVHLTFDSGMEASLPTASMDTGTGYQPVRTTHVTETPYGDAYVTTEKDARPSLYVSGTISSDPDLSFEEAKARFDAVRDYLEALGYRAVSPTDMEGECGRTAEECVATQRKVMPGQGQGNHSWECYLKGDIRAMLLCDGVALLPNWERSSGAFLEVQTAKGCGMDVRPYDQWPLVQAPLERAAAHAASMDLNEVAVGPLVGIEEINETVDRVNDGVTAVDTCRQCEKAIQRMEDGRWLDGTPDRRLAAYCPASIDPDPVHVPRGGE